MRLIDKCFCFSHMDYLTKSYESCDNYFDLGLAAYTPFHVVDEVRAAPHYHKAYKLQCGAVLNMSDDTRQGCKIDMGGDALMNLRAASKWSDETIIKRLSDTPLHKRTTRLDYAFNIVGAGNPRQIRRLINKGKYNGRLKPAPSVNTPGQTRGESVYFGSKDAAFRIRVYDKAAEMGDLWMAWTRCEAQFREEYAQNAASDAHGNRATLAQHTRTRIAGSVGSFPLVWWQKMLDGETVQITSLRHKTGKFEARMEQIRAEIITKAEKNPEKMAYIINEWLPDIAISLGKLQGAND